MSLVQQRDRTQRVLDAVPDEVAILDSDGRIGFTNRAWQRFAEKNGLRGDASSVGLDYLGAIQSGPDARGVEEAIRSVLNGTKDGFRWTYPCHSPTEQHWFEMKVGALSGGGAVVIHTEVTDRIVVEDAKRRLSFERHQRERLQEERGRLQRLLNQVSHDIATPLTPLMLQLDRVLRQSDISSETRDQLDGIRSQTERLVAALRSFQHHAEDALPDADRSVTDLQTWLQDHQKVWESMASQRNLHLDVSAPDARLAIPPDTLAFIMASLLDEGFRTAPLDGSIHIHAHVDDARCTFEIHRSGPEWDLADPRPLDEALAVHGSRLKVDQDVVQWSVALAPPG